MQAISTKAELVCKIQYGVITLGGVMASFFATKFNNILHGLHSNPTARSPPHFDLISKKFKLEAGRNGL